MTRKTTTPIALILSTACIGLLGCTPDGAGPRGPSKEQMAAREFPKTGLEVPKPPEPVDVPLDKDLQAAARKELEAAAAAAEPDLRVRALDGMRSTIGEAAGPFILRGLKDGDAVVRFAAAMAAGELKVRDARQPLAGLLEDQSPSVQVAVRFALHKLGDTTRSHDLEVFAIHTKESVRANTAVALGRLGEPSAMKILRRMRLDANPKVRQQASEALCLLGDEQGQKDLLALLNSAYADDQMFALLALGSTHNERFTEPLRSGLKPLRETEKRFEVQLVAARAVAMVAPRSGTYAPYDLGYTVAVDGAKSKDPRHRSLAALAFGAIGRTDAQETLRGLLKDPDGDVRIAAATALLELGKGAPAKRG